MILTKKAILKEIKAKRVKINPIQIKNIGPASIDMTLDSTIRVFAKPATIKVTEKVEITTFTKARSIKKGYELKPGELVLGITKEKLTLPDDICAWIQSRSRFARLGLMVHMTAPFLQPGISNKQVLELYNASPNTLILKPGLKLCSVILHRTESSAHYHGSYRNQ